MYALIKASGHRFNQMTTVLLSCRIPGYMCLYRVEMLLESMEDSINFSYGLPTRNVLDAFDGWKFNNNNYNNFYLHNCKIYRYICKGELSKCTLQKIQ